MLSQDVLKNLLDYDPETGELFWKERPLEMFSREQDWKTWNSRFANKPALNAKHSKGYREGHLLSKRALAHRVIWKLVTGEEPDQIDHQNGNYSDNRWSNLRSVSVTENNRNVSLRHSSRSGVIGVSRDNNREKWVAQIAGSFLGRFETFEEAVAARKAAESQYGFHQNHGRVV